MPPMRADWTASGACTSGSTAPPRGATRRASGGAATTSTTRAERSRHGFRASFPASLLWRLSATLRRQHSADNRLARPCRRWAELRMPGQAWHGAAASFLGMWVVMMLPSLVLMLWRYRQAVGRTAASAKATASCAEAPRRRGETRLGRLTALVGVGYFSVWTVFGMAAFPLGVALATVEMQQPALARAVPIDGGVVLIAGALQFTA